MENNQVEREFGWDDTIQKDSEYVLLPEGDYDFVVEKVERARFMGSDNMPACNKAILSIRVFSAMGSTYTTIYHSLLLHTKTEWALSQFFTSIGQKKKGEPLQMNWQLVTGAKGRCKLGIKQYNGKDYNEIKSFLKPQQQPTTQNYTPGQF